MIIVTAKEIAKKLNKAGASWRQGRGSLRVLGKCRTVVPMHTGDMATGTWKSIEKDMEPCLGKRWLTR